MSSMRHQILREVPLEMSMNMTDPFRDPIWRDFGRDMGRDAFNRDAFSRDRDAFSSRGSSRGDAMNSSRDSRDSFVRDMSPPSLSQGGGGQHQRWEGLRDYYHNHHPTARESSLVPHHHNRELYPRHHVHREPEYSTALVPVTSGALPLSRSFFNPERQLSSMDGEMSRMAMEMRRMFGDMQHLMPVDSDPESWRTKENFLLENPIVHDNDGNRVFRLKFDVRQFRPEEIFVKTMGNELAVHAKHEEKGDDKSLHREYKRLYVLPKDLNAENLVSKLNRDGVLSIEAKLPPLEGQGRDRLIPIKHE